MVIFTPKPPDFQIPLLSDAPTAEERVRRAAFQIKEWWRGCSCAPEENPEECPECTRALVEALMETLDFMRVAGARPSGGRRYDLGDEPAPTAGE